MPPGATGHHKQLFTKRSFIKVNNDEKLVRVYTRSEYPRTRGQQQKLIRLVPVGSYDDRARLDSQSRSQKKNFVDVPGCNKDNDGVNTDYRTFAEEMKRDKSMMELNVENVGKKTQVFSTSPQLPRSSAENGTILAIQEGLTKLLHGQQEIGSRLDFLQKEQTKNKEELEGGITTFMEELKGDIFGKSLKQTEELEKFRAKQQDLYNEFSFLNLRLGELEHLVSNLLKETKDDSHLIVTLEKPAEIHEITRSESLQSVLSISSGSTVEDPLSQEKKTRKSSQAFLFSQAVEDTQRVFGKGEQTKITHL